MMFFFVIFSGGKIFIRRIENLVYVEINVFVIFVFGIFVEGICFLKEYFFVFKRVFGI